MRRLGLVLVVLVVLAVAGCDALRDAFSAHADVAARAAGQTLTAERLAGLAALSKRVPLQQASLASLAHVWVDYANLAAQLARGMPLDDSATVVAAAWPAVAQLKWERFHDRLIAQRATLTPAQVDSAYRAGTARLFQHILLQVPPSAPPTVDTTKRRQMEDLVRQAARGGGRNFGQLAARHSEDPASKSQGGALGVAERGQFVAPFEDAAWQLDPGAISGVVRSSYGYHLIRRPPLAEVRDSFHAGMEARLAFRFDSLYLDSLATKRQIEVRSGASALARQAVQDLNDARDDDRTLVSFRGGRFRVRDLVRWMFALDPSLAQGLPNATNDQLRSFLRVLAQRQVLLLQADSAGLQLTPEDWARIRTEHDSALTILQSAVGISARLLRDSAAGDDGRQRFAMARVNDYLERVLQGRAQFVPVPPFLGNVLRAREDWKVSPAGVARALERATAMRAAADSLAPPAGQAPPLEPAPGPPPIPGPASDSGPARPPTRRSR